MKILRIRHGFATNSSSLHSIVWLSKLPQEVANNSSTEFEFGWDMFLQKTRMEKQNYLLTTLAENLYDWTKHHDKMDNGLPLVKEYAPASLKELLGFDDNSEYTDEYIYTLIINPYFLSLES